MDMYDQGAFFSELDIGDWRRKATWNGIQEEYQPRRRACRDALLRSALQYTEASTASGGVWAACSAWNCLVRCLKELIIIENHFPGFTTGRRYHDSLHSLLARTTDRVESRKVWT